ncbi:MAG: hypothetical protein EAZ44_11235 [Cytophagia bacterium]|nr:MAG: hypothetical protein EAZ44_11235 [Cytophagia bacterium]
MIHPKLIFSLLLFFVFSYYLQAQKADTCKVGVDITALYDFKIKENSFTTIFWMWRVYKNDSLDFSDGVDIVNSKNYTFGKLNKDKRGKQTWTTQKIKAECQAGWKINNFPFDKQKLRVYFDDSRYDVNSLIMVADKKNSRIDDDLKFADWKITDFRIEDKIKTYKTTYGDPLLEGSSQYSQITMFIELERKGSMMTYFKILTGLFFSFAISLSVSLIPEKFFASRMPVCVGGLFSAVGSKYIAENIVPSTNEFTLIDIIHNITFLYILLCIISGIIAMQTSVNKSVKEAHKWDIKSFFTLLISYIMLVSLFTLRAMFYH